VALDVTYGNMSEAEAERLAWAAQSEDAVPHEPGCTEPWISRLVADFIVARGARTVLETGCFKGATSVYILDALQRLQGGEFYFCDIDEERARATMERLGELVYHSATHGVNLHCNWLDILRFLQISTLPKFDLAWVDDNHEKPHVEREIRLLYPRMAKGGLILLHDVYGQCDLKTVVQNFGGYSIDLPRLGPAGGLGIIQVQ